MPVKVAVENRDKLRFVVFRYSGHIDPADVLASATRALSNLAPDQPYRELLIFKHDTDLSNFDPESLATLYRKCDELYRKLKLGPRIAAAVLDASVDAKLIMPLFNAVSLTVGGPDLSFELFTDVEPALKRLGVPVEEGLMIVARAA
jgi:hypothetical protein